MSIVLRARPGTPARFKITGRQREHAHTFFFPNGLLTSFWTSYCRPLVPMLRAHDGSVSVCPTRGDESQEEVRKKSVPVRARLGPNAAQFVEVEVSCHQQKVCWLTSRSSSAVSDQFIRCACLDHGRPPLKKIENAFTGRGSRSFPCCALNTTVHA